MRATTLFLKLTLFTFTVCIAVLSYSLDAVDAKNAPVRLEFTKSLVDDINFIWEGTVTGDVEGQLTTMLTDLRIQNDKTPIWHVEFDWIIDAEDPAFSFTAHLKGTLNTRTGRVIMNGTVVDGWLLGAQVHEAGQQIEGTFDFEGTIRIMPGSAD